MRLINIIPQAIAELKDELLFSLWQKLNVVWESENPDKEEIVTRAIFLINEIRDRDMKIEETELYKAAEEWREKHKDDSDQENIKELYNFAKMDNYSKNLTKLYEKSDTSRLCEVIVEYGAQTENMNEYFLNTDGIDYRIIHRKVGAYIAEQINESFIRSVVANYLYDNDLNIKIKEAIKKPYKMISKVDLVKDCNILASAEKTGWITIESTDQFPYVLTKEACDNEYMPDIGFSALPKKFRERVPEEYQFWLAKEEDEALSIRNKLIEAIDKGTVSLYEPYPNEHAARIKEPKQFDSIKRQNDKFGPGIHALFGIKDNKSEVQAIRFSKDKVTPDEAKEWLKKHDYTPIEFEPAATQQEAKFVLQHQWFKENLSEHWDLRIDTGDMIMHMVLEYNPLKETEIEGYMHDIRESASRSWFERGRKIERINPGNPGNLTESSPSWLQMIDEGSVDVSEPTENSMKLVFNGKKMKESWIATLKPDTVDRWVFKSVK